MKFFITFCISLCFSALTLAHGISPLRYTDESYKDARNRQYFAHYISGLNIWTRKDPTSIAISPEDAKKPLAEININEIVDVGSYTDLESQFRYIRDTRFLSSEDPNFPRRITWLYPDDGCYSRAEVAKIELANHQYPSPKKIFVFGDLVAATKNTSSGFVEWWYHVAIAYRIGSDIYVFDPAVEPLRPLKLNEWNDLIGGSQASLEYSVCSADTFDPSSDCYNPVAETQDSAIFFQQMLLDNEWNRLLDLNRKPEEELGENPPWLTNN